MGEVFPAGGVNALAGLHSPQAAHPRSPAKRGASRGEAASTHKSRGIPGLRRKRLTRATARRPHTPVARLSAARAGGETASMYKSRGIPGLRRKRLTRATARRPHTPVARLSAARAGEKPRRYMNPGVSPGCGVNALPGLHSPQTAQPRSPAKRSASRGETASIYISRGIPGLRRKRLTRATARRLHTP